MKNLRNSIIVILPLLCLSLIALAVGLAVYVPGVSREKTVITVLLLALSPVPVIVAVLALKSIAASAEKAGHVPTRDRLTNLYNRATFWDFLGYEIERSKRQNYRFAIMLVDLDNFKAVNDQYGHEAGDAYLIEFSSLLKSATRKGDIVARYEGDNFAAILPVCDEAQSYIASKRLLDSLREHTLTLPDGTVTPALTASAGVAVYPDHAKDAQSLFQLADGMLHHAKATGKDRVSIPSDEVELALLKSAGEKSIFIMDAIRKNRFVPYFQPIVSVHDGSLLAYEVLTRIVTPERVIPASEFIEEAEGMGAIAKIDYLLMDQAFDKVKQHRYTGKLFFNLSPKVLVMNEFMTTIRRLMAAYGIEPPQLVLEITERDTVKDLNLIERITRDLNQEGFQFAIDDFGSGYSSFQYIRLFRVDYLKVDGQFTRGMIGSDTTDQFIMANIAALAGRLGIKTIAESVESELVLGNVRLAGVDYAQGFHIRRPMPDLIP
jgi:diguanylate cyclase (GGDEF)-like protein